MVQNFQTQISTSWICEAVLMRLNMMSDVYCIVQDFFLLHVLSCEQISSEKGSEHSDLAVYLRGFVLLCLHWFSTVTVFCSTMKEHTNINV